MNVKVITRHSPSNYGSLLQSIATIKVIERLGHVCEIIDYQRTDERGFEGTLTQMRCKEIGGAVNRLAYMAIRYPIEALAQRKFDKMRKHYLTMTKRCSTLEDLQRLKADVFMTGSDQVWGPMMNGRYDEAYFLDFVKEGKKVSYAASFGKTKFDYATEQAYRLMLKKYDKIAVREDSAVTLLKKWELGNCIGQVLDPTLLLTGDEWREFSGLATKNSRYILFYQIHNDPALSAYAKQLAAAKGLELVRVTPMLHQIMRGGKLVYCPDAKRFIQLIENCEILVTDSFHGTCFAINLNKQFIEILPNNNTGTRNQSILQLTGLSNRIVTNFNDFSLADKKIDYCKVNEILEEKRCEAIELMKN